jgi:Zn-dependent protease
MRTFIQIVIQLAILFFSIIVHEVSHGYVALKSGDPTAKYSGRLTLNPLPHIDIFGTIILPLVLLLTTRGRMVLGWAKPVPINPYYFREPKRDIMLVGAAGPAANIGLAIIFSIIFRTFPETGFIGQVLGFAVFINLLLAIFNLVPVPPLDGSRILQGFLPPDAREKYMRIEPFGFIIIFFLLFIGLFGRILIPLTLFFFHIFTGLPFRL